LGNGQTGNKNKLEITAPHSENFLSNDAPSECARIIAEIPEIREVSGIYGKALQGKRPYFEKKKGSCERGAFSLIEVILLPYGFDYL
tara:strand:+ start:1982 stop:2242 length:261 start_codon:yes stop_codon:yes gene_type:complete